MYGTGLKKFVLGLLVTALIFSGFTVAWGAPFVDSGKVVFGVYTDIQTMDPAESFVWYSWHVPSAQGSEVPRWHGL
jgi:hypothetical protein